MPTKARGPLQEDIKRLIRAARWAKLPNLVFHEGSMTIVMPLDGTYVAKLAMGQPPAPDVEEEKREPHNWKNW